MNSILVSSVGRRGYVVDYLKSLLPDFNFLGIDADSHAPGLFACDHRFVSPSFSSSEYIPFLENLLKSYDVSHFFSLNDYDIGTISGSSGLLESSEARFWGPKHSFWLTCMNKLQSYDYFLSLGVISPPVLTLSQFVAGDTIHFPDSQFIPPVSEPLYVVKPLDGSGSVNTYCGLSLKQVLALADYLQLGYDLSGFIVQPMIIGQEYNLDLLFSCNGSLLDCVVKKKISMRAGETDKAVYVKPDPFADFLSAISVLPHCGNLDCDVIVDHNGSIFLVDVNPRFGGGFFFSKSFKPSYLIPFLASEISSLLPLDLSSLPNELSFGTVIAKNLTPQIV